MLTRSRSRSMSVDTSSEMEDEPSSLSQTNHPSSLSRQSSTTTSYFDSQDSAPLFEHAEKKRKFAKEKIAAAERNQWVAIIPDSVFGDETLTDQPKFITFPHSQSDNLKYFLLSADQHMIYEVNKCSDKNRSWFIGDSVQTDGSLFLCTPMDPLFLVLPFLVKTNPKSTKSEKFTTLDNILEFESNPQAHILLKLISDTQWLNICERKEFSGGISVYRYSEEKTLQWLKRKVEILASKLKKECVYVGSGSQSSGFVRSKKMSQIDESEYFHYASGMIEDYLPTQLATTLSKLYPSTITNTSNHSDGPPKKKRALSSDCSEGPTEDYTKFVKPTPKLSKSTSSKLTSSERALAKVDKKGMKSLTSFFGKK